MHLCKLLNVFVQIAECICPNYKMYNIRVCTFELQLSAVRQHPTRLKSRQHWGHFVLMKIRTARIAKSLTQISNQRKHPTRLKSLRYFVLEVSNNLELVESTKDQRYMCHQFHDMYQHFLVVWIFVRPTKSKSHLLMTSTMMECMFFVWL